MKQIEINLGDHVLNDFDTQSRLNVYAYFNEYPLNAIFYYIVDAILVS